MAARARERCDVAYPGYTNCTLNIIPDNLIAADNGDIGMQNSIAWQYFKTLGMAGPPSGWEYSRFSIARTGWPGRPPKSAKKKVERHCCDYDNCTQCDVGYHQRCRHGCTL